MSEIATPAKSSAAAEPKWRKLADNPYAVLALIFLVTGCLGIPVIMICRAFSPRQKVLWIVVSILYTTLLFVLVGIICVWAYGNIMKAMNGG
jgi:hypothetical protein